MESIMWFGIVQSHFLLTLTPPLTHTHTLKPWKFQPTPQEKIPSYAPDLGDPVTLQVLLALDLDDTSPSPKHCYYPSCKPSVISQGGAKTWISAHRLVSRDFEFSKITEQVPILQIRKPIKEGRATHITSSAWSSATYASITTIFGSSSCVAHILTLQTGRNFLELVIRRISDRATRDEVCASHWLQHLPHSPAPLILHIPCIVCFAILCILLPHICLAGFYQDPGDVSNVPQNVVRTHQRRVQRVTVPKIGDGATHPWYVSSKLC